MAETTEPNNPVARLYQILEKARKKDPEWKVGQVWADVFGVGTDVLLLHLFLAELIRLVYEAQRTVEQLDAPDQSDFLVPFQRITELLAITNLDQQWHEIQQAYLDPATMSTLQLAANAASIRVKEITIRKEKRNELQAELETLMKDVLDTAFSEELEAILLEKLKKIRTAIITYRISGTRGLRQAVEESLCAIYLYGTEFKQPRDEKIDRWCRKWTQFLISIVPVVFRGATVGVASGILAGLLSVGDS